MGRDTVCWSSNMYRVSRGFQKDTTARGLAGAPDGSKGGTTAPSELVELSTRLLVYTVCVWGGGAHVRVE